MAAGLSRAVLYPISCQESLESHARAGVTRSVTRARSRSSWTPVPERWTSRRRPAEATMAPRSSRSDVTKRSDGKRAFDDGDINDVVNRGARRGRRRCGGGRSNAVAHCRKERARGSVPPGRVLVRDEQAQDHLEPKDPLRALAGRRPVRGRAGALAALTRAVPTVRWRGRVSKSGRAGADDDSGHDERRNCTSHIECHLLSVLSGRRRWV